MLESGSPSGVGGGGGGGTTGQAARPQTAVPTGLPPKAITTAYGFPTTGGSGKTIAIVDAFDDPTIASNLDTFSSEYGLPPCTTTNGCFTKVNQTGGTTTYPSATSGWALEISLDVEWAHALAPGAHILLVEVTSNSDTNLFVGVTYAAHHAQYVSMSWGGTEFASETSFDSDFTAVPSVSYFAAAGDSGERVLYPSASPDVVSVGGTTLTVTATTYAWQGESAWSKGGGGCSAFEQATAAQKAFSTYYQAGVTCDGARATPDVALDANPKTGVSVYDTLALGTGLADWLRVGGTSASTVMWAARSAVAGVQVDATYVYGANIPFYDVASGTNGATCAKGYNLCTGVGSWNESRGSLNATLGFATAPQTVVAGQPSTAMALDLSSAAPTGGLSVSLSTGSSGGGFSTTATGTFGHTLTVSVPGGATKSGSFYYRDTKAGSPVITASAQYLNPVSQTETVGVGALSRITVSPASVSLTEAASQSLVATGVDQFTNPVVAGFDPTWTTTVGGGTFSQATGASTTFTAGSVPGGGVVTATQGSVHGTVSVTVKALSKPASVVNSATWMNVFYDSTSGDLMNAWWQSTSGWHDQVLAKGMVGSPAAIVNSSTWMDVFYDSTSGDLMNAWWQSTSGWHDQVLATGMVGSPAAVTRTATSMDVFYESSSGQLMDASWHATSGWAEQAVASGDAGAPTAVANSATWMDVFYQSTSGQLMNAWWQSTSGWHDQALATGEAGAPSAVVNSATWMDVFYQSTSGQLMNAWWQSTSGWHDEALASGMVGTPASIARTATSMDIFYQSTSGQLMNAWWQSKSGWHDQALASGEAGAPSAVANSATWMDAFYLSSSGKLMNAWWQSTNGWHDQTLF